MAAAAGLRHSGRAGRRRRTRSRAGGEQVVEHRAAQIIHAGNLTIEHGVLEAQIPADPLRQVFEVAERVAIRETRSHWPFST